MSKHTPGPWTVCLNYRGRVNAGNFSYLPANSRGAPKEEWQANAHLIAAAPDLLAALKEMVTWMPSGFAPQSQGRAMKMAHDAIAKAEGAS